MCSVHLEVAVIEAATIARGDNHGSEEWESALSGVQMPRKDRKGGQCSQPVYVVRRVSKEQHGVRRWDATCLALGPPRVFASGHDQRVSVYGKYLPSILEEGYAGISQNF